MGWACGTYGGNETWMQGFGGGKRDGKNHLEDTGVDGMIIFKWSCKKQDGKA